MTTKSVLVLRGGERRGKGASRYSKKGGENATDKAEGGIVYIREAISGEGEKDSPISATGKGGTTATLSCYSEEEENSSRGVSPKKKKRSGRGKSLHHGDLREKPGPARSARPGHADRRFKLYSLRGKKNRKKQQTNGGGGSRQSTA